MTGRNRRNFSPGFRLEAAQLLLDRCRRCYGNERRQIHNGQMGSTTERRASGKIPHYFTHDT